MNTVRSMAYTVPSSTIWLSAFTGYRKEMELVGVGYRASATGQVLELSLGFSHAIYIKLPRK